ncbi:MAG: SDR family NAD(P)-dependent oxidoreductase [Micavibrio aeruginosavorus]|nr:SDR family NAD(P)-dependent oxidoreductase [Micavibrio aeruginosavorus]
MTARLALITGVTGGFGSALARRFAAQGYRLALHARDKSKLDQVTATLGKADVIPLIFDMRDIAAMEDAVKGLPPVDILVNNAGLALGIEPAQRADIRDWDEMIATNVTGLVHMTHLLLPQMAERKSGHIVNIGSVAGNWPYPGGNVYCATKAFVKQFSLALRSDLHGTGVRVTDIEPGLAETNFSIARFKGDTQKAAAVYAGTMPLSGDDIAEAVFWAASLPAHVNINSIEIMPTVQSFAGFNVYREQQ